MNKKLRLLVAIPCLNEDATIAQVIGDVPRLIEGIDTVDVLVIDDGSTDRTHEKAAASGALVIQHPRNLGVGKAFHSAVNFALEQGYDVLVNIDGDRQFNPKDIPKLVVPVLAGRADMVTASRFIDSTMVPDMPRVKLVGNRLMSQLVSSLVRQKYHDVSCGFRSYSREALLQMNLHGAFTYTQETFLDFAVKRMTIVEIPIAVQYFPERKSRVVSSISKYALHTAKIIFRGYRDYFPLRFFWGVGCLFLIPSLVLAAVFFGHYFQTGYFTGYLFAGFLSGFFLMLTTVFFVVGIVADMLDRIRTNQERILYRLKKRG